MVAARLPTMLPTQLGARIGAFSVGGRDPNYVYNAVQLDALLQANGVDAADVVSTWDAIWPVLIDPATSLAYATAADADDQMYGDGVAPHGILKQDIIDAIPDASYDFGPESFEGGASAPTGFSTALGTVTYDATPPVASPDGGKCLSTPDRNNNAAVSSAYLEHYFQIRLSSLGFAATAIFKVLGTSSNAFIDLEDDGDIVLGTDNGANKVTLADSYAANQWYHVKMIIDPGVKVSVEFSTDGTFSGSGNWYAELSTGVPTAPLLTTEINGRRSATMYLDRYIGNNGSIPDNP